MVSTRAFGLTDVGLARSHNEDCYTIDEGHRLFVVADGMGGHSYGEVASQLAVEAIQRFVLEAARQGVTGSSADPSLSGHGLILEKAVHLAHHAVLHAIHRNGNYLGMGTTVVGALLSGEKLAVAHVGDSRAYRYRDGKMTLLTNDHTWVNEQVEAGHLSPEQARFHPLKNVVTRALGGDGEVEVDLQELDLEVGDRLLLCSDGLTTMLTDDEIVERLQASEGDLQTACYDLVSAANARGGFDNVTVLLVAFDGTD